MKHIVGILCIFMALAAPLSAQAACEPGAYGHRGQNIAALTPKDWVEPPGLGFLLLDGRYGATSSEDAPIRCAGGVVYVTGEDGTQTRLEKNEVIRTPTSFTSWNTELAGELIEPADPSSKSGPLVVMVHGSGHRPALTGNTRALLFAAQGISVFIYDKRGTGRSEGLYTQNFQLLAEDAAVAMAHARTLAKGRFGRSGYFGPSQGGWVAPLAARQSDADFVAVGFGLIASPISEDRAQMLQEARALGLGDKEAAQIRRLSETTAHLVTSHFTEGFEALEALRREFSDETWADEIDGEYSGDMLRMSDANLRRLGRALFDNIELIWDYDARAALSQLDAPLLWVLAGKDREAPIEETAEALSALKEDEQSIDAYIFPNTDHVMYEFIEKPDGTRHHTRVTEGYFRLLADWIHGEATGTYGRATPLSSQ